MSKLYYHATTSDSASLIKKYGFKRGTSGMNGAGMYFADNPLSAQIKSRVLNPDAIIVVRLNVGRLTVERSPHNDWNLSIVNQRGYDSVQTNCRSGPEICVYESWRISIVEVYFLQMHKTVNDVTYFKYSHESNSNKIYEMFYEPNRNGSFTFRVSCNMKDNYYVETVNGGANINGLHVFCDFTLF